MHDEGYGDAVSDDYAYAQVLPPLIPPGTASQRVELERVGKSSAMINRCSREP